MESLAHRTGKSVNWVVFGLTMFFSASCQSVDKDKDHGEGRLPPNTKLGIVLTEEGEIKVIDHEGKPAVSCQLCTEQLESKYGKACSEAPKDANICEGLTSTTLQSIENVVIIKSHKNPFCYAVRTGGTTYITPRPPC